MWRVNYSRTNVEKEPWQEDKCGERNVDRRTNMEREPW